MAVSEVLRIALVQMKVGMNKVENVRRAVNFIKEAKDKGSQLVILPECFNSPYSTKQFESYAEVIPDGETCKSISKIASESGLYVIAGSIPERCDGKLYNTSTIWSPTGSMIGRHRKMHLFDINIPGGVRFMESDVLSSGNDFTTFSMGPWKIGIGICYDVRFTEMASVYRKLGVNFLVYPGAFNMNTGPLHWELLMRARAVDNQVFVAGVCSARDESADYIAWGHSILVSPWGKVLSHADAEETLVIQDINLSEVTQMREQIPTSKQRRTDLYDTIVGKKPDN